MALVKPLRTGFVRPLEERDIPWVVGLHRRVLPSDARGAVSSDAIHAHVKEMFLNAPWSNGQPSLVYENGDPVGFLGVMSRRMRFRNRQIHAVVTAHFIVEPTRRATMAAIELLKAVLSGPQDLTLADEAGDISRKLFEGVGGVTSPLYSLYWVRPLRPCELAVAGWKKGRPPTAATLTLLSRAVDAVVRRWPIGPFQVPALTTPGAELSGDTLAACITEVTRTHALHPHYDGKTATWILDTLARKRGYGKLRKALVRTATDDVAGWYVYSGDPGGVGEVLQVGANEERLGDVLDHLFAQAWRDGMIAVTGRIDPHFMAEYASHGCFFHHRGSWMLVHAQDPELLSAIQQGDAFLTPLEGEWCMRF